MRLSTGKSRSSSKRPGGQQCDARTRGPFGRHDGIRRVAGQGVSQVGPEVEVRIAGWPNLRSANVSQWRLPRPVGPSRSNAPRCASCDLATPRVEQVRRHAKVSGQLRAGSAFLESFGRSADEIGKGCVGTGGLVNGQSDAFADQAALDYRRRHIGRGTASARMQTSEAAPE